MAYALIQQRAEAKTAMVRIFRFKARRGLGAFYILLSLLLLTGVLLFRLPIPPYVAFLGTLAAAAVVWRSAEGAGFRGFDRMAYSLRFLEAGNVRVETRWYERRSVLRLITISCAAVFAAARFEKLADLSFLILSVWMAYVVILNVFAIPKSKEGILERRWEDWAVIVAALLIPLTTAVLGSPIFGICLATPIYLVSGLLSLHDAPRGLAIDSF